MILLVFDENSRSWSQREEISSGISAAFCEKTSILVWNRQCCGKRNLIREIKELGPRLLVTVDLAGFDQTTLTDVVAYNLLDILQIHLLLHTNLGNECSLEKPLSLAMFFYFSKDWNLEQVQKMYPNIPSFSSIERGNWDKLTKNNYLMRK